LPIVVAVRRMGLRADTDTRAEPTIVP